MRVNIYYESSLGFNTSLSLQLLIIASLAGDIESSLPRPFLVLLADEDYRQIFADGDDPHLQVRHISQYQAEKTEVLKLVFHDRYEEAFKLCCKLYEKELEMFGAEHP
ncbi:unnamed protein product, partial [Allacma fusca]